MFSKLNSKVNATIAEDNAGGFEGAKKRCHAWLWCAPSLNISWSITCIWPLFRASVLHECCSIWAFAAAELGLFCLNKWTHTHTTRSGVNIYFYHPWTHLPCFFKTHYSCLMFFFGKISGAFFGCASISCFLVVGNWLKLTFRISFLFSLYSLHNLYNFHRFHRGKIKLWNI